MLGGENPRPYNLLIVTLFVPDFVESTDETAFTVNVPSASSLTVTRPMLSMVTVPAVTVPSVVTENVTPLLTNPVPATVAVYTPVSPGARVSGPFTVTVVTAFSVLVNITILANGLALYVLHA